MSKKIIASIMLVTMVVLSGVLFTTYAANASFPSEYGSVSSKLTKVFGNTWETVIVFVQIASVATVVFAGVRYMFASAERRADIKKGLTFLVIGAILIFAASTVATFIVRVGDQII